MGPYDTIAEAVAAWKEADASRAETLFERGVAHYAKDEPDGVAFALGRYGAFLKSEGRPEDAIRILERAIKMNTDIPAIWSDYLQLLADRREIDLLFAAISRKPASRNFTTTNSESLLGLARRAAREGDLNFAEAVASRVRDDARVGKDRDSEWAAVGDLGQIIEKAGRDQEALDLLAAAFDQGSDDPVTATRLTALLERKKEYAQAVQVASDALGRGLAANVEEQLRKRLVRCEGKLLGGKRKADVSAFSVRLGADVFRPVFQTRIKPPLRDLELVGGFARCLAVARGESTLIDVDLESGRELRRIEHLPQMHDTQFSPTGWGIGIERTARVGAGPTNLVFLDPSGEVVARSAVPDATSQIALSGDSWYVGCRNGLLYAFDRDGARKWEWETPGARGPVDSAYMRPCPYYVAATESFVTASSMSRVFGIRAQDGKGLWAIDLSEDESTKRTITISVGGDRSQDAYRTLQLTPPATKEEVKSAYRHLALRTHPDRNPEDPDAAVRFRDVQVAYESILAGEAGVPASTGGVTLTIEFASLVLVSFLTANETGVLAGSSQGRLYHLGNDGRIGQVRILGDGQIRGLLRPDGSIAATWCDGVASFFEGTNIVNAVEVPEYPTDLALIGDDVVVSRGNELWVLDRHGHKQWAAEFSKRVTKVIAEGSRIVCAAGVLAGFERTSSDS